MRGSPGATLLRSGPNSVLLSLPDSDLEDSRSASTQTRISQIGRKNRTPIPSGHCLRLLFSSVCIRIRPFHWSILPLRLEREFQSMLSLSVALQLLGCAPLFMVLELHPYVCMVRVLVQRTLLHPPRVRHRLVHWQDSPSMKLLRPIWSVHTSLNCDISHYLTGCVVHPIHRYPVHTLARYEHVWPNIGLSGSLRLRL